MALKTDSLLTTNQNKKRLSQTHQKIKHSFFVSFFLQKKRHASHKIKKAFSRYLFRKVSNFLAKSVILDSIQTIFLKRLDVSSLLEIATEFLSTESVDNLVDNSQSQAQNPLPISKMTDCLLFNQLIDFKNQ